MKEIKEAVFNHLTMDSHGALLITGHWGSGKTYYVKNTLFDNIKNEKSFDFKPIIVSVYGESNTEKISSKIFQKLISSNLISISNIIKTSTKLTKAIPFLKKYVDTEELVDLVGGGIFELMRKNNVVLFFDDLERLGDGLSINDFLGYVNDLTENHDCKVIIIANQQEADKLEYKEKTISKTIEFSMDTKSAFNSIKESYKDCAVFYSYLDEDEEFFINSLSPSAKNISFSLSNKFKEELQKDFSNIRSLKSALEHFKVVFEVLDYSDLSEGNTKLKFRNLWCFCLAVTIETRKPDGLTLSNTKGIDDVSRFYVALLFDEKEEKPDQDLSFENIYKKKYFERLEEPYNLYKSVYGFITAGRSIDKSLIEKNLNSYFPSKDYKGSKENDLYNEFMGFKRSQITDDEFPKKIELLLNYTEEGAYDAYFQYINVSVFLFEYRELFTIPKTIEEIEKRIRVGILKNANNKDFSFSWSISKEQSLEEVKDDNAKRLIAFIDEIVSVKESEKLKQEVAMVEELLLDSPTKFYTSFMGESKFMLLNKHKPIFAHLNPKRIIARIPTWQAEDILMFGTILEKRYVGYNQPIKDEFENILQIINYIIEYDVSERKFSNYYIENILKPKAIKAKSFINSEKNSNS